MTPPRTIISGVLNGSWFRSALRRRLTFLVAALVLAVLCIWPRHYIAKADMMPQDSGGGLSALLTQSAGGLVSLGALIGSHQSIEADLTIGRSQAVLRDVIVRLHLTDSTKPAQLARAEVKLRKRIDISAIRGSILQIRVQDASADLALRLVAAYTAALQDRLTALSLQQSAQKRAVANNRMADATVRLAKAQAEITQYRAVNKVGAPEIQLGAAVSELAALQGKLQARQVELQTLLQFATPQNVQVKAAQADIAALQHQIATAEAASGGAGGPQLGALSLGSAEYVNLYRNEKFAENLYSVYSRYLEEVTIDELSANANLDVIEPPYIEPSRQYNTAAVGLLILVILIAIAAEFYLVTPPIGERRRA